MILFGKINVLFPAVMLENVIDPTEWEIRLPEVFRYLQKQRNYFCQYEKAVAYGQS